MKQKIFFLIPTSKGLTRQDPDLIPNLVGIGSKQRRDLVGINPDPIPTQSRDPLGITLPSICEILMRRRERHNAYNYKRKLGESQASTS